MVEILALLQSQPRGHDEHGGKALTGTLADTVANVPLQHRLLERCFTKNAGERSGPAELFYADNIQSGASHEKASEAATPVWAACPSQTLSSGQVRPPKGGEE